MEIRLGHRQWADRGQCRCREPGQVWGAGREQQGHLHRWAGTESGLGGIDHIGPARPHLCLRGPSRHSSEQAQRFPESGRDPQEPGVSLVLWSPALSVLSAHLGTAAGYSA